MRKLLPSLALIGAVLLFALPGRAEDFEADGPHRVDALLETWTDAARDGRAIPGKIYFPADVTEAAPVVIVSHGLGGSREGYAYIGKHLASHGYICVHVTHVGSDTEALLGALPKDARDPAAMPDHQTIQAALKKIATNPSNALNRPRDVSFAIDRLLEMNGQDGPLKGRIDAKKIGVAGHSFGAYTAMAIAGQKFGTRALFRDERITAAVVMSPPAREPKANQFEAITIPLLLMTGTQDESPLGGAGVDDRRKVFDFLTHAERYLLIFEGGDHMVFSGRPRGLDFAKLPGAGGDASKDVIFQTFVKASTLRFFDAYLRADENAKRWLTGEDGAKTMLGNEGTWRFEKKAGE
jgi:predicted dienelactone hydrolase